MTVLKKNWLIVFSLGIIFVLFFLFRLPNLTLQPIFADEAIYIRWAQVMKAEPTLRFVSLTDGKTPLFMWMMIPVFKVFHDPLFAGRILSVFAGFLTLLGLIFAGWKFFKPQVGLLAGFLYAITSFVVFFDRLALVDSMLAAFSLWSLILAMLLIKNLRTDLAMVLGYSLGAGLLTKTTAMFNLLVLPTTLFLFNFQKVGRDKRIIKTFLHILLAVIIAMAIYNILRLGPGFSSLNSRNQDYVRSPLEVLSHPLDPFIPHARDVIDWFLRMLGIPMIVVLLFGIGKTFLKRNREALTIFFWALIPLLIEMALLKTFTARYILFSIPPLILITAYGVDQLASWKKEYKKYLGIILAILLAWPIYFNFLLLTNPAQAPLAANERRGYLEDWTAGYSLDKVADFLKEQAKAEPVVVGTEGAFGTLPDGLYIYLDKEPNISVVGGTATISAGLREAAIKHPTFFVANRNRIPQNWMGVELLKEYEKAVPLGKDPQDAIQLYKVLP